MENSNIPSTAKVQSNDLDKKQNSVKEVVKPNQILNGNQVLTHDRHIHASKTMHEMTPGPKKYQNIKKSPDKEPKFVPYEPYKAAVRSIVPELGQPSVAIFKRRLSTASNCSKASNATENNKEDMISMLTQEKQVIKLILFNTYFQVLIINTNILCILKLYSRT